jgi:hypothetical protein
MDPALSPDQYRALRAAVRGRANCLHRIRVPRFQRGATDGDPLYDLFGQAERALQPLSGELHNRSIRGPRRPWEPGGTGSDAMNGA